ncbi:MAG: HAD family hydrolase [Dehalococcoidia bacterium]
MDPDSKRAVTLDLWQTLIAQPDGTAYSPTRNTIRLQNTLEALAGLGEFVPETALEAAFSQITQMIAADHLIGVDMHFDDRVTQVLLLVDPELPERIGPGGIATVAEAVDRAFDTSPPHLLPGVPETLEALQQMGLQLGLISNTGFTSGDAYRRFFDNVGLTLFFKVLSFSNDMATAKPSPDIFHPTLEALGVEPASALHVGDNLLTDVSGAAAIGMRTAWITGYDLNEPMVTPDITLRDITHLPHEAERWRRASSRRTEQPWTDEMTTPPTLGQPA